MLNLKCNWDIKKELPENANLTCRITINLEIQAVPEVIYASELAHSVHVLGETKAMD